MEIREIDFKDIGLKSEIHESEFLKDFLRNELLETLKNKEIKCNNLYIDKSYSYEKEEYVEIGVYIINTSHNNILVNSLPLIISDGKNKVGKILNIKEKIERNKAIFRELKISKSLLDDCSIENLQVLIGNLNDLEKYEPIELELNIEPKFKKYISKREFNKFIKNLPKMDSDSIVINVFKRAYVEDGYFISLIFRNSSNRDVTIDSLPIVVTTSNNLIIYEGVMEFENNSCVIPSNKAVLKNIVIPLSDFPVLPNYNGIDFKILFKNL